MRYSYLKGPDGRFQNPYDHGCRKNCSDFLIQGYQEDVEVSSQQNSSSPQNGGSLQMLQMSSSSSNVPSCSSSNLVSSNGTKAHYHQHSASCSHSNRAHSSNFVSWNQCLWLVIAWKHIWGLMVFLSIALHWYCLRISVHQPPFSIVCTIADGFLFYPIKWSE